jgi:hypothetical protein
MAFRVLDSDGVEEIRLTTVRLSPTEAEVQVAFRCRSVVASPELRGRLMGPRCPYAETIEIAYPVRPLREQPSPETVVGRVVIPEPSLWDPVAPFLYQGPVELWAEKRLLAKIEVSHGLRAVQLVRQGLRWNGQPLLLRGRVAADLNEGLIRELRREEINTVVMRFRAKSAAVCELADRFGMLVLFREVGGSSAEQIHTVAEHVSCLGYLMPGEDGGEKGSMAAGAGSFVVCDVERAGEHSLPCLLRANVGEDGSPGEGQLGVIYGSG